ncbi:hypothetical protein LINPERHAP1_LOCUS35082 [Linum perenne]
MADTQSPSASVPHPRLSSSSSTLPAASSGLLAQPTTAARTASLSLLRPPQSLPLSPCSPPRRRSLDVETLNVPGSTADSTPAASIAATGIAPAGIAPRFARRTSSPTALAPPLAASRSPVAERHGLEFPHRMLYLLIEAVRWNRRTRQGEIVVDESTRCH